MLIHHPCFHVWIIQRQTQVFITLDKMAAMKSFTSMLIEVLMTWTPRMWNQVQTQDLEAQRLSMSINIGEMVCPHTHGFSLKMIHFWFPPDSHHILIIICYWFTCFFFNFCLQNVPQFQNKAKRWVDNQPKHSKLSSPISNHISISVITNNHQSSSSPCSYLHTIENIVITLNLIISPSVT